MIDSLKDCSVAYALAAGMIVVDSVAAQARELERRRVAMRRARKESGQ